MIILLFFSESWKWNHPYTTKLRNILQRITIQNFSLNIITITSLYVYVWKLSKNNHNGIKTAIWVASPIRQPRQNPSQNHNTTFFFFFFFFQTQSRIIDLTLVIYTFYNQTQFNSFNRNVDLTWLDFQAQSNRCCAAVQHHAKTIFDDNHLTEKEWVINILSTHRPGQTMHFFQNQLHAKCFQTSCYERIDCRASCCWGCKDDHVEAKVAGGKVCWSCLSRFTIRLAVCSVARSLPHRTYTNTRGSFWLWFSLRK